MVGAKKEIQEKEEKRTVDLSLTGDGGWEGERKETEK